MKQTIPYIKIRALYEIWTWQRNHLTTNAVQYNQPYNKKLRKLRILFAVCSI